MRLDTEFIRLPLAIDAERLRAEVAGFAEDDWRPHPQGHPGNSALPLIARGGDPADDGVAGEMLPTPHLGRTPYMRQVLAALGATIGRSRLMRLDGNAEATMHVDTNYYWADRVRVHIPIVTDPAIEFICDERSLHMAPGEVWIFDAWRRHNVLNPTGERRIHLVADTVGSAAFWDLVAAGSRPFDGDGEEFRPVPVDWNPDEDPEVPTERSNLPVVMSPWEQERLAGELLAEAAAGSGEEAARVALERALRTLQRDWRNAWARNGEAEEGWPRFRELLDSFADELAPLNGAIKLPNGMDAVRIAQQMLITPALNPELALAGGGRSLAAGGGRAAAAPLAGRRAAAPPPQPPPPLIRRELRARRAEAERRLVRPVFVVAPPRSGTSLLFEALSRSPELWTIGGESHEAIESIAALGPAAHGWDSNRLTSHDAQPAVTTALRENLLARLRDRDGRAPDPDATGLRLLEKTPKNCLRVPFLDAAFGDATFVYLYREPQQALASMLEAWESGRFVTYPQLPGWEGPAWSLLLTPGWRELAGRPLAEIVAAQWESATRTLLGDLERLGPERWCAVGYDELVADPDRELARIADFAGFGWDAERIGPLPPSATTLTAPDADKASAREAELADELERLQPLAEEAGDWVAEPERARARSATRRAGPMSARATTSFGELLAGLSSSLLISTYQANSIVAVRRAGGSVNTHFRSLQRPMGIAHRDGRLAVGCGSAVVEYRDLPEVAARLERAPLAHDACFVPQRSRTTGDIAVHDLAWGDDELWLVASRFSCLATLDEEHSFVPRWRPPFVTELAADDRCHLNGLAVRDGQPAYVTALGVSDEPGGWRAGKADGGVVVDVESGETIAAGLSMPHSPRWHGDRLWVLESGKGGLATVDPESGEVETVAELPGFTRGLAFVGPIAFVGLSMVREGRAFGGLPITAKAVERQCGVYAVDTDSGTVLGFLSFADGVEEIYDVELLEGVRFPEIAEPDSHAARLAYVVPDEALSG
ncbi:MAG: TIGR03032 family protein [Solirubrobacterales bacterium]|nr:TIGR03032 family protein [Thermoleophilales bacterium]MCO5325966.1 TIGR03032 family protein [Solirubrobacterales bacterium]